MNACFFIGHSDAPSSLKKQLIIEIEKLVIEHHVFHFIVGNYGAFDTMAAGAVKHVKQIHPEIMLQLLVPYHPAERITPTPQGFDGTLYPFERAVPKCLAIVLANQMMIDSCKYLLVYAIYPGNSRNLLDYAQQCSNNKSINIINLAEKSM